MCHRYLSDLLVEDFVLSLLVAADKVIERLDVRLSAVCRESEVYELSAAATYNNDKAGLTMVLEVESDARQVDEWLNTGLAELLRVAYIELAKSHDLYKPRLTDARSLEDERRAQGATTDDDILAGLVDFRLLLVGV